MYLMLQNVMFCSTIYLLYLHEFSEIIIMFNNSLLKKLTFKTSFLFTALTFLYAFIMIVTYNDQSEIYLSALKIAMFLPFSFFCVIALEIINSQKLAFWKRFCINEIIILINFYFFIYRPSAKELSEGTALVVVIAFMAVYTIGLFMYTLIKKRLSSASCDKNYQNVYKK